MSVNRAKARVAVETKKDKRRGATAPSAALQEARRALAEENIRAYAEKAVARAPELSTEARSRLAAIFGAPPAGASQHGRGPVQESAERAASAASAGDVVSRPRSERHDAADAHTEAPFASGRGRA